MKICNPILKFSLLTIVFTSLSGCFDGDDNKEETLVNNPPAAMSIDIVTQTETAITERFPASDPDAEALNVTIEQQPSFGTLSVNNDATFTYTPFAEVTGSDSFSFKVSDAGGLEASATVGIVIEALQVPFTQFARDVFSADAMSSPSAINGREFIQDGINQQDYQDLIDNN